MNRISQEIARWIKNHVLNQVRYLQSETPEYRAVFNGPPSELLQEIFSALTSNVGHIEARLPNGTTAAVPVLLQVDQLPIGTKNPLVGKSGLCDDNYLLSLRNSTECPIYLGLISLGQHSNISQTSTRSDFGLGTQSNMASGTIYDWWNDPLIQLLVDSALARHAWGTVDKKDDAKKLIEASVVSADGMQRNDLSRRAAWAVLSRVWSVPDESSSFANLISLASGYPTYSDVSTDTVSQIYVLREIASRLEESHIRQGIERIKLRAINDIEKDALDSLLHQLQKKCEVITALGRSMPHYYGPFVGDAIETPPEWWKVLTVDRWLHLLDEDKPIKKGGIRLECVNLLIPPLRGLPSVVASSVEMRISLPDEDQGKVEVLLTREGARFHREWTLQIDEKTIIEDLEIISHKAPIRYTANAIDKEISKILTKGSIRIISLSEWEPGVIVHSRTASKGAVPKATKKSTDHISFETNLELTGHGRHYLDVHLRPGVVISSENAHGSDDQGLVDPLKTTTISRISDTEYGFEIDVSGECFYQFEITRPEIGKRETVRVYLTGDEIAPQECGSEFERLILLNSSREAGRATTDVHVNRQLRASDLQGWMLSEKDIEYSFYPLVFGPDYASTWRTRDWRSEKDTVISKGQFLNDPRPSCQEMQPPVQFVEARKSLAKRIRGDDGNGVIESARLGEWLVTDVIFGELVEDYVKAYHDWLTASPEVAAWSDISIITRFESDASTLVQEPDAILISPLHPVRFAWQCLAQKILFLAQRKLPCPAASILDPDCIPDTITLPLRSAAGGIKWNTYFSAECSSDYWGVLWNASKLDRLANTSITPPFDREFGVLVGGVSSGFSVSQVHRALDDVFQMLVAKPVINITVSSASGQNNSCNDGIISWCRDRFSNLDQDPIIFKSLGNKVIQILDERKLSCPENVEISNLAEDTDNAVKWYAGVDPSITSDLGIIAQLEISNAGNEATSIDSPVGFGGLIRGRIRQQLKAGEGAILIESRMGRARAASGDGLADKGMAALTLLENLSDTRLGYVFAPSVHAISNALQKAEFAAVSSSAVDPSCFLGGWLKSAYLWDYELPSYSSRAGDSNGYYLLSRIKELDRDTLRAVLSRFPSCKQLPNDKLDELLLEVARRGIPTVRGLSGGDSGASGDLGLFIAARLLQDSFRGKQDVGESLLPVWVDDGDHATIFLVIPIDPFQGYLDTLSRAIKKPSLQRPDLIVAGITLSKSGVSCKLTPIEVKYRRASGQMSPSACNDALQQAKSLSALLESLSAWSDAPEMILWKLAFQHLLISVLGYGFRVYSQQAMVSNKSLRWSEHHNRVVQAILSEEIILEIDKSGRLIVVDGSPQSSPRDFDSDGFVETVVLNHDDAGSIVKGDGAQAYESIRARIGNWALLPAAAYGAKILLCEKISNSDSPIIENVNNTSASEKKSTILDVEITGSRTQPELPSIGIEPKAALACVSDSGEQPLIEEQKKQPLQIGVDLLIGNTIDGFNQEPRRLNLSDTNLNQLNIGVVGDLGTGKTQLLKSLIYQINKSSETNQGIKPRILIFDYKKDYSSEEFVSAVGARVVKPHQLPLNLFDITGAGDTMNPWLDRYKFFSDVLDKIFSGIGPVQRNQLKRAVREAYVQSKLLNRQPNIYDIHIHYEAIIGNKSDSIFSIIDDLVDMEMFSPNLEDIITFDQFLDGVVVISLDALGQDDKSKNMLVAIMLNMFYEQMLRIPKRPYVGIDQKLRVVDSLLLVDEADNIMRYEFDVLRKILLQGREFGVGVILASQYLRHFKAGATDYREPLLSWFIHKVPNVTALELSALGLANAGLPQLAERIKSLSMHECLFKTHNVQGDIVKGIPFYKIPKN